jgi:hypothetical protein
LQGSILLAQGSINGKDFRASQLIHVYQRIGRSGVRRQTTDDRGRTTAGCVVIRYS